MTTEPTGGSDTVEHAVPLYILAGGRSRRFGSDKARALCGGVPLVVGVARALSPVAASTTVVAAETGSYEDLGLRTIGDVVPDRGPLGGLLTALADRGDGWIFLSACDWVGIRAEWARALLEARTPDSRAVVYRGADDRYQPLFAAYHGAIRDVVAGRVAAGTLELRGVFIDVPTVTLPPPAGWHQALNLNRPPA